MEIIKKALPMASVLVLLTVAGVFAQQDADSARADRQERPMMAEGYMGGMMGMMGMIEDCMDMMDGHPMMSGGAPGPETALHHRQMLELSGEQVEQLERTRDELREARRSATERMRAVHDELAESTDAARASTRDILSDDQRARLSELTGRSGEGMSMMHMMRMMGAMGRDQIDMMDGMDMMESCPMQDEMGGSGDSADARPGGESGRGS